MPKKAYLAKHFSSSELKEKYLKSTDPIESRRWHLLWKVSLGWTIKNRAVPKATASAGRCGIFLSLC